MSAFQVGPEHLNYLVNACQLYDVYPAKPYTPQALGEQVAQTNADSLNARYPQHRTEPMPYVFTIVPKRRIEPVQVIKAVHCYQYQSCEHDGWTDSDAKKITDYLTDMAIGRLPGYDEADWEIS